MPFKESYMWSQIESSCFVSCIARFTLTHCYLFINHGVILYMFVYVDDIILIGSCSRTFDFFTHSLYDHVSLKDVGDLTIFWVWKLF